MIRRTDDDYMVSEAEFSCERAVGNISKFFKSLQNVGFSSTEGIREILYALNQTT